MMSQHDNSFSLHVEAPYQVKQKVSKTNDNDGAMEVVGRISDVIEGPRSEDEGRNEAENSRHSAVKSGYESAIPFR